MCGSRPKAADPRPAGWLPARAMGTGPRTVCVTGGLGFIGVPLCLALADLRYRVVCVDRLTGRYAPGRGPAAAGELARRGVAVVQADIAGVALEALLENVDAVVHLAALPGVRTRHGLAELWDENTATTARLVEATARVRRRLVFVSSSSVYGDVPHLPATEDSPPCPLSPYAVTKLAAEGACMTAARQGADVVIVRPFTVFGPGQRPDMAFARWIGAITARRPVVWCAHPHTRRELTYIDDAVAGLIAALEHGRAGQAYNIPGAGSFELQHVLDQIEGLLDRDAAIHRRGPWPGEAVATAASPHKAARELRYQPAVALRDGLERQIAAALPPD